MTASITTDTQVDPVRALTAEMTAPKMQPMALPDPVEHLSAAITAYQIEQRTVAARMLAAPDHTLDGIRNKMYKPFTDLMTVFDGQKANTLKAAVGPNPTLTNRGRDNQLEEIGRNKLAAIEALAAPLEEALSAAEAKTRQQIAKAADVATPEHIEAATNLAYQVQVLTPQFQIPPLARAIKAAAEAKDVGAAAALMPILQSLNETNPSPMLGLLITRTEEILSTWQWTVANARLERIQRLQWELSELKTAALMGGEEAAFVLRNRFGVVDPPAPVVPEPGPHGTPTPQPTPKLRRIKRSA